MIFIVWIWFLFFTTKNANPIFRVDTLFFYTFSFSTFIKMYQTDSKLLSK